MGNIHVKLYKIRTSGSGGDVLLRHMRLFPMCTFSASGNK